VRAATLSESCSLVRLTTEEPSRSFHGEGHVWSKGLRSFSLQVFPGYGELHALKVQHGTGETRLGCLRQAKTVHISRW
jgi:hypothetical protein